MSTQPEFVIPLWTLADRLRKAREHAGLDQVTLAKEIDISRATVSNYERGLVEPRKIAVRAWALRTGVPFSWLMYGADGPNPDPLD